jgi:YHS domain-containing protein
MKSLLFLLAACVSLHAAAQPENASRLRNFNQENGVALRDFDPVSYFKGKPAKGDLKLYHVHKSIKYFFSTPENLEAFKKSPAKYEPAYGGWCAYSMSVDGKRVKIDPMTYKIIGGKLYLFSNSGGNNTLLRWNPNEGKLKASADKLWLKTMN